MRRVPYRCAECGASGCKLWRLPDELVSPRLLCARCAGIAEGFDVSRLTDVGKTGYTSPNSPWRLHSIGQMVPAIPDCDRFRDYFTVGSYGWWRKLPNESVPNE